MGSGLRWWTESSQGGSYNHKNSKHSPSCEYCLRNPLQIALKMKKMDSHPGFSFFLLLFLPILFAAVAAAAPAFVSGHIFRSQTSTAHTILQAKKACPVNFEFLNYTIITSKCKGPKYTANVCCSALAKFACPYAQYLNDLTNDCAVTMFRYINLYGKYPPGLFSTLCNEKNGLQCPKAN